MNLIFLNDTEDTRALYNNESLESFAKLGFKTQIFDKTPDNNIDKNSLFFKLNFTPEALNLLPENSIALGLFKPFKNKRTLTIAKQKKLSLLALDLIPRSTLAQSMDVLSSQANLAGYQAVIEASYHCRKIIPLMMTPAGSIPPCRVVVLGAGVAGLQAIATAKRLGAIVEAFDTRPSAKENIESLGAKAIDLENITSQETTDGYANALNDENQNKQQQALVPYLKKSDIIITTAQVFGKKAPILITKEMLNTLDQDCVIVDLATQSGGNVEGIKIDSVSKKNNITLIGICELSKQIACTATSVLSKNILALIKEIIISNEDIGFSFNEESEIFKGIQLCKNGDITHPMFSEINQEVSYA